MKVASRLWLALKALRELGPAPMGLFALYQLGLKTGHYHRQLSTSLKRLDDHHHGTIQRLHPCLPSLPDRDAMVGLLGEHIAELYKQADQIVGGKVRLFGGQLVPLSLTLPGPLADWTLYERGENRVDGQDIKFIWEPGRFGWACKLAMAYHLSNNEQYSQAFWHNANLFLSSNSPYYGPHWSSAQEVAIRLVALAFSLQVFTHSKISTPELLGSLAQSIAIHAERISPTLVYARSQNNNHLITEALGLYTASALLPEHPLTSKWHKLGWKWLQYAFQTQISPDGTYIQHSSNYHRLMLQAALWAYAVHDHSFPEEPIPMVMATRLGATTHWLWKLLDPESGRSPNLGHNDGAYILPLTACPYYDYRPVIHAAARTFLNTNLTPNGAWCDMGEWLCSPPASSLTEVGFDSWHKNPPSNDIINQSPPIIQNQNTGSWATVRIATFHSRPAHADQLHMDLWWHGLNLAQDPGTYLYNSPPPWDNSLTSSLVHNTLIVDGKECMRRSGRFLYLDWAQAKVISMQNDPDIKFTSLTTQHNGYRKLGVVHTRNVTSFEDGHWEVIDLLEGSASHVHTARLHWLVPDWEYEIQAPVDELQLPVYAIRIHSPFGWISLKVSVPTASDHKSPTHTCIFQIVRAGELLFGSGKTSPISGWTSPTYGEKIPALACILEISQPLPIELKSEWILPCES